MFNNETNLIINTLLVSLILSFYHNLKQKHFLGDSGSLMLSSFIAFFIIYLYNNNIEIPTHQNSAENILILFLIPVLDMVRLFFERLINKQKPSTADKNHLHHYLIEKMSDIKALIVYFIFLNIPIMTSTYTQLSKIYIITTVVIVYFLFIFYHKFTKKNT